MKKAKFFLIGFLIVILLSTISLSIPTIVVEETELVKVEVDTFDPDEDNVTVIYSAPLDENGEWKTDYGDAGNYTTFVTATDGKSLTEEEFTIIVKRKNKAPSIKIDDEITAQETEKIKLKLIISDPNGDPIKLEISEPFDEEGIWQTSYEDGGEYTVTIKASDGELESVKVIKVIIDEKNRAPRLIAEPEEDLIEVDENEGIYFSADAIDEDNDQIVYVWELDDEIVSWDHFYVYAGDYDSAGSHVLRLIVSDGVDEAIKEWNIEVADVNRAPVLPEFEEVVVEEGETLILSLPEFDEDGDNLIYYVDGPIGDDLEWKIDYEDAGEYEIEIEVSDGELTDEDFLVVIVKDVDRAPVFVEIEDLEINETDNLRISLKAEDPDDDEVYFLVEGFPEEAILDNEDIFWQPDYDVVAKPNNFMVRLLSRMRIDKYLWQSKAFNVNLMACGKDLCSEQIVNIKVNDVNREPQLWIADKIIINETDKIQIKPGAADPDGDVVKFYFAEPLSKNGKWQTSYNDAGEYEIIVGATDGKVSVEKVVELIVNNKNRKPELDEIKKRTVNEGEEVWIKMEASDPDGDYLDGWLEGAPEGSSFEEQWFSWTPGHEVVMEKKGFLHDVISNFKFLNRRLSQEKENFGVTFVISDDDFIVSRLVDIVVRNWNRAPEIVNSTSENVQTIIGEPVLFTVEAVDLDGDELEYNWDFGFMQGGVENTDSIVRRFTSPGQKKVTLSVSDGRDTVEKVWNILVANQRVVETVEEPIEPSVQPTFVSYAIEG